MATIGEALTGLFTTPKQGYEAFRKSPNVRSTERVDEEWPVSPRAYDEGDRRFLPQSQDFVNDLLTIAHIYGTRIAPFPEGPTTPLGEQLGASDIRKPKENDDGR